ncbi:MAG: hypothetical protein A2149_02235 [Candidatus Schekmanbacteria bacterium RBG_16_38_11]|uniref:Cytoplasmic protein n=2 Tax=Candidatus Schekmaniibacteriota TaxID=1817811 RepID=A0A1F7RF78_9BACT|nr:MAG: hypothetical protein A2042_08375 [Candidatus Schekmanbacteria bacterium GWA2_38_11]OGL45792.1 MAG: hypothetical protein A2149_02235 [Candidatus Schekmanbacteria bacterium RBG_16_38_11]
MVIGACKIVLRIPDSQSLKSKRYIVRKIKDRVRHRFNVSISEVDDQDLWQVTSIGFATVSNDRKIVQSTLDQVVNMVEDMGVGELLDYTIEIL